MAYVHRAEGAPDRTPPPSGEGDNVVRFRRSESGLSGVPSPIDLAQLIEGEIIPRLLAAHQSGGLHEVIPMNMGVVDKAELESFAHQTMTMDLSALVDQVELLVRRGVSVEGIYFDLLSPSAKLLGEWWEQDVCTFADVTVGLCRLQQLVYEYADRVHVEGGGGDGRTALFALTPGDQHSLGLIMVVEYFRQAGWRTICMPDATERDLEDIVQTERFDLIGFSMANERWLEPLTPLIARLRAVSRNASVRVMVGGRVFAENPDRVAMVGADQTATDAHAAVQAAARLFASQHSAA
ncbi:cobalamin B12-binding domain-containing protein [Brevundimonas subvibrioides]|jgi:MerR family transcriptional regulator, light-induced transcriptional regulator|uniref:Cobalamin B12-binding domain protein n=1 Tax=Brevundimonas subvibrioides (strain ATCC 15264 / DSM 4735 / LMG 14903 / NBRC 16000 / CB 81) TaxID=633149 RepID=D9QPA5_BRESC|nr:cobalamin B12-binding domain-containing protein [Brevundimonas subvibrioides]ADL02368.1 cobalamin B12-binding domain protein [Brevundimonas subvibrioides ATCC 15264]